MPESGVARAWTMPRTNVMSPSAPGDAFQAAPTKEKEAGRMASSAFSTTYAMLATPVVRRRADRAAGVSAACSASWVASTGGRAGAVVENAALGAAAGVSCGCLEGGQTARYFECEGCACVCVCERYMEGAALYGRRGTGGGHGTGWEGLGGRFWGAEPEWAVGLGGSGFAKRGGHAPLQGACPSLVRKPAWPTLLAALAWRVRQGGQVCAQLGAEAWVTERLSAHGPAARLGAGAGEPFPSRPTPPPSPHVFSPVGCHPC